jgi:hypothetical protein
MAASTSSKKLGLRRGEKFFLTIGLIGSIAFGAWWLTSNRLESYQSWRFDQSLQGRRSSWIAYVDYLTFSVWKRMVLEPTVGSPRVPIVEIPKPEAKLEEVPIPENCQSRPAHDRASPFLRLISRSSLLNGTDEWVLNQGVDELKGRHCRVRKETSELPAIGTVNSVFCEDSTGNEITLTTTEEPIATL